MLSCVCILDMSPVLVVEEANCFIKLERELVFSGYSLFKNLH